VSLERPRKGANMPISTFAKQKSKSDSRLHDLRIKNACRVQNAHGDPEEIRKEGLSVYSALAHARQRANQTAHEE